MGITYNSHAGLEWGSGVGSICWVVWKGREGWWWWWFGLDVGLHP